MHFEIYNIALLAYYLYEQHNSYITYFNIKCIIFILIKENEHKMNKLYLALKIILTQTIQRQAIFIHIINQIN